MVIGYYLFYALFAAIFKHEKGFQLTAPLMIASGIVGLFSLNFVNIYAAGIAITVIAVIEPIQIRNGKKSAAAGGKRDKDEPATDEETTEKQADSESEIIANTYDDEDCGRYDEQ